MNLACSVEGCTRIIYGRLRRGLCPAHYRSMLASGSITRLRKPSPADRLAAGLDLMPSGCIEWTKTCNPKGYGNIFYHGKQMLTHRLAWELANGPIRDGLWVLHHCDNPPCCNVEHLFLGTSADNIADRDAKGRSWQQQRTHCPQGHPYDEANTHVYAGGRYCRTCIKARNRAFYLAKIGRAS